MDDELDDEFLHPYQLLQLQRYKKINRIVKQFNELTQEERRLTGLTAITECAICHEIIQPTTEPFGFNDEILYGNHLQVIFFQLRNGSHYTERRFNSIEAHDSWWAEDLGERARCNFPPLKENQFENIVCERCSAVITVGDEPHINKIIHPNEKWLDWVLCCEMNRVPINGDLFAEGDFTIHDESPFLLTTPFSIEAFEEEKKERMKMGVWPYDGSEIERQESEVDA